MKKILFINTLYPPNIRGGAEIVLQAQVEGLKHKGYNVIVLATKDSVGLSFDMVNQVKVYRAGIKNIYWHYKKEGRNFLQKLLWHAKDIYNAGMKDYVKTIVEEEKPDIVICHNLTGWSVSIWDEIKKYNIPIIQVVHDLYLMCSKSTMYKNKENCENQCFTCSLFRKNHPKMSNQVDVVVGVSQFILNKLVSNGYFGESKKAVIYNRLKIEKSSIYKEYKKESPLRIGFIGTLVQTKGLEPLILAFKKTSINATLSIAGKGEEKYEQYLRTISEKDKRIQFLGYQKTDFFYSSIDLLVVPSLWNEPLGMVAIEACANNIPVIAYKTGGLPEIIKDGINGMLIEPNIDSLYNSIMKYYQHPELLNHQKELCQKSIENFLDFNCMIDDYTQLIEQLG